MSFTLPALPFAKDALAPLISAETFDFHHGKHHNAYVVKANELIAGTAFEGKSLEEVVKATANDNAHQALFNNVGQHYNHSFFWNCLSPNGGGEPTGKLAELINASFGNLDGFKDAFSKAAVGQFGSGWAWLVYANGKLEVTKSANAETPLTQGKIPLLVCDVWEHAYYLDYQNRRADFIKVYLDKLVNWNFAAENLAKVAG